MSLTPAVEKRAIEKRATRRFSLCLPIEISMGNGRSDLQSTRDVSARGVSFYSSAPLSTGADIHFTMTLPPEVTQTESISMRCAGRVVRVEQVPASHWIAVAAVIDHYEFLGKK